MDWCICV